MRSDVEHRKYAAHIEETNDKNAGKKTGINGLSVLANLKSIDFPKSFPPDSMHLFSENVVPDMCKHYRGVFFNFKGTAEPKRPGETQNMEDPAPGDAQQQEELPTDNEEYEDESESEADTESIKDGESEQSASSDVEDDPITAGSKRKRRNNSARSKSKKMRIKKAKASRGKKRAASHSAVATQNSQAAPAPSRGKGGAKKEKFATTGDSWNLSLIHI